MHFLIDGHNVIAKMTQISLDDPDDEVKLVQRLRSWAAAGRKRYVTVIFDGGLPGGHDASLSNSRVKVLFASQGDTADRLLIRRIRKATNPAAFTLISSDREVVAVAKKRKMRVWLAEKFAASLETEPGTVAPTVPAREQPNLSEEELAEWLALFPEPERKPTRKKRPSSPSAKPQHPQKPAPELNIKKELDEILDQDEVDAWLRLFGEEDRD